MLDHEVLQVWMWDIYLIGAHLFHWDTPGRFTEWAWNTSNTPCWKGDAEGVDVILEVKRVWMCWSILPAFRFPKFSVCVVFVNMNNMLACFLYRWTTLLNLDEQLCWIFGPPRSCAGARKSLVFKVEENNMSMNMLVTVMMLQMKGENIIKCLNIWKIWHIDSSSSALPQILLQIHFCTFHQQG